MKLLLLLMSLSIVNTNFCTDAKASTNTDSTQKKNPYLQGLITDLVDLGNYNIKLRQELDKKYRHELFRTTDKFQSYYPKSTVETLSNKVDQDGWYTLTSPKDAVLALKSVKKRPLLVVFDSQYCGYCKVYKDEVLSKKEINNRLKDMVRVHVDVQTAAGQVFASLLNSQGGTPRSVFVDPNKDILETIGGYVTLPVFKKYLNELGY
ncbi:MAG: thioredoxin family protein [Candidatus Cloacimonetes bacterium]|nr:thioredoxin family protein [Candidatus Cloacimonadota bacterium]